MPPASPTAFPEYGLSPAQRREAVLGHYYETPGMDGSRGEIWCYSDQLSYQAGEKVTLFISSNAGPVDIEIGRDGADYRKVLELSGVAASWQDTPADCSVRGCGWRPSYDFLIPGDWPSGAYRVTLSAPARDGSGRLRSHHLFIVRPAPGPKPGRLLQVAATGSWTAYNTWGGSNHYQGITGPEGKDFAPEVSLDRPFARGFIVLPPEAPRVPLRVAPPPGEPPRYPHMEWAYSSGHSKKYASAGWASYDRHFFRWAEKAGYEIDLASQHELHFRPELLEGYGCFVTTGHDEYWSWEMRDRVDAFIESGGRAARFAGNFMWQIRLEEEGRRQVCYKYRARGEDPLYDTAEQRFTSTSWESAEVGRPARETFGLSAARGLYAGWGGCAPRCAKGFPLYRPDHWALAGTGLYYGDLLGGESQIFGYEVDGLDYRIEDGLPLALGPDGAPLDMEVLALGLSSTVEELEGRIVADGFLNDEDGRYIALILEGDESDASLEKVKRGCGMIVNFKKGRGEVFHAGTTEWVAGLLRDDAQVQQVTRNVLDRYLRVTKEPAHG